VYFAPEDFVELLSRTFDLCLGLRLCNLSHCNFLLLRKSIS
jgi:hypothetical protein